MNQLMNIMSSIGASGMQVESPEEVQKASHKFNKSLLAYTISLHNSSLGLEGGKDMLEKVKAAALANNNFLVEAFLQAHAIYRDRIESKDKSVFESLPIRPKKESSEIEDENMKILWMHLKKLRKNSLQYKMACSKSGHKSLGQLNIPDSITKSLDVVREILKKNNVDKKTFINVVVDLGKAVPGAIKMFEQFLPNNMNLNTDNFSEDSMSFVKEKIEKYLF